MNVPQAKLDQWRAAAGRHRELSFAIGLAAARGSRPELQALLDELRDSAIVLLNTLEDAGADRPSDLPQRPNVSLALLSSPANRQYAQRLRDAWEAGLAVDRERYSDRIGTDGPAGIIEMVLARVEEECYGPSVASE